MTKKKDRLLILFGVILLVLSLCIMLYLFFPRETIVQEFLLTPMVP